MYYMVYIYNMQCLGEQGVWYSVIHTHTHTHTHSAMSSWVYVCNVCMYTEREREREKERERETNIFNYNSDLKDTAEGDACSALL